jgi:hypothetical protein
MMVGRQSPFDRNYFEFQIPFYSGETEGRMDGSEKDSGTGLLAGSRYPSFSSNLSFVFMSRLILDPTFRTLFF